MSQLSVGNSSAAATNHPRRKRDHTGWSAMRRSSITKPTNANGHQPHGGSEAARSKPAPTARRNVWSEARLITLRRAAINSIAASRPWRMHAGTPRPRNAAPVTRTFGASSASLRSMWSTRSRCPGSYCGNDRIQRLTRISRGVPSDVAGLRQLVEQAGDEHIVVERGEPFVAEPPGRQAHDHILAVVRGVPTCSRPTSTRSSAVRSSAGRDTRCRRVDAVPMDDRRPWSRARPTSTRSGRGRRLPRARRRRRHSLASWAGTATTTPSASASST